MERRGPDPHHPAALDQLHDADAGLGESPAGGRLRQPVLTFTHVLSQPRDWLGGSASTVIFALVYGYIPYLILPLFASLDRIDRSHLEAARDLGAAVVAFLHGDAPALEDGILGGAVLITLPMFGDYYTPNIVSGAPRRR